MINTDTRVSPSFSLKNRLGRVIWHIAYVFFFQFSPKPFFSWRSFLLRLFGAKVGRGAHIYPKVKIWAPWNLVLGDQCGIANGVMLYSQGEINIGNKTVISQGAHICAGTHDYTRKGFPLICMPINIGNEAWVAADAFIHPGVTIGDGCVIGARAVVVKDMPPWMVCAGHPCRPIKKRIVFF
ncbi:WcaF family extracellular polysaccharide biosynthesis acetyltransferase [Mucilaginibacter sp.]|uniref:WcaF family extracellular polysaccharide biosynthesis acetyltransferase n=1 Tax=Mucilaginibacter sp. TaxID=1882438 RepID=UPI00283C90CA|nr:WcaF family extracellular polysaccharide biosynthesis acetyltransferase [Mucilaginibacter sp.]MDR3697534.1 WcaF family extracellular polysaccharide biosynthesis acetyltransferase [Mucilaginibacter sp.]